VRIRRDDADQQHWAVLEIEDRGVGIPANELSHVFEPFYRRANVPSTASGTGLGPWACRTIVEQHGGTLSIISRENEGTTVIVRLPVNSRSRRPAEPAKRFIRTG
jgi:signal transduction histidine kinase